MRTAFDIFGFDIFLQETDILTDNLAEHLLTESEVLFQPRDHRTVANLQESMVGECSKPGSH